MRSDQYAPIELQDGPPSSTGATPRRLPRRRLLVSALGLMALSAAAFVMPDAGGMNLETASESGPVGRTDTASDASAGPGTDTLVVRTPEESSTEARTIDGDGAVLDGSGTAITAVGSEMSIGSAESAESNPDSAATGAPASSSEPDRAPTNSNGEAVESTQPSTPTDRSTAQSAPEEQTTTTTRRTTTTERTTTTRRATTTTTPTAASGPVVWVDSRAAGGGDGSKARPFRTIIDGILAVRAGETLMVKGGEYREHVNPGYRMPRGTSSSRITMTNAPGERVVIKGRVILTDMDYWTFKGINVTWDSERNDRSVEHLIILNGGVNWEWRDSEVWGAKAYSAMLITDGPRNFAVRHNHIHDTYPTNDTNQDHLIYCACGTGGGVIERNLLVGSSNGRAVKLGGSNSSGSAVANVKIRYNTMVDNYGPSNIQLSFNTSNITMERNLMVGSRDYAENISTWKLTGSGSRATNNLGYKSPGVLENHGGIANGGGNIHRNPRLDSNHVPQDDVARAYGHTAS